MKISLTRISALERKTQALRRADKRILRKLEKLNRKLYARQYHAENKGLERTRSLVTKMQHAEKALKQAVTPWCAKKEPTRFERYVKVSSSDYNRLRWFLAMPRKRWETFRVLFLK